jgi:hypothetical protein
MALDEPQQPADALDIDLIAASFRADTADVGTFVEALAVKLEQAVPGAVKVERVRERMFGAKFVRRIAVDLGDQRLDLRRSGAAIETSASRLSGGIVLKSEPVDIEAWLGALGQALATEASRSQTTRQALERLLNG